MSETVRPRAKADKDSGNLQEPSWPQLIRRSVLWGVAAAVGSLLGYVLPDRWAAAYILAIVLGIGVLIVRRDKALWLDRPWEFVKKYPLEVIGTVLAGSGAIWLMFSLRADESPSDAVGLLFLGGMVLVGIGYWLHGRRELPSQERATRLSDAKFLMSLVLFFGTMAGCVLLYVHFFE